MLKLEIDRASLESTKLSLEEMVDGRKYGIREKLTKAGQKNNDDSYSECIEAASNCFAVVDVVWQKTVQAAALKRETPLPAIFSSYIGAEFGLNSLGPGAEGQIKVSQKDPFWSKGIDFGKMHPSFLEDMLDVYARAIENFGSIGLLNLTGRYFEWIKARALAESQSFPDFAKKTERIRGSICGVYEFYGMAGETRRQLQDESEFSWENFGGYKKQVDYFKDQKLLIDNADYCLSLGLLRHGELLPKGTILHGPPGTGKTRLLRTFCHEAKIPFFIFSISEVANSYINGMANDIQREYDRAARPVKSGESRFSLMAIDEFDSIDEIRDKGSVSSREGNKVVSVINNNMDGYLAVDGVVAYAMTNRLEALDKATIRPGRFERFVHMGPANRDDSKKIFEIYLRGNNGNERGDVDVDYIVERFAPKSGDNDFHMACQSEWTPALIKMCCIETARERLLDHLKTGGDYRVSTEMICRKIEELYPEAKRR